MQENDKVFKVMDKLTASEEYELPVDRIVRNAAPCRVATGSSSITPGYDAAGTSQHTTIPTCVQHLIVCRLYNTVMEIEPREHTLAYKLPCV